MDDINKKRKKEKKKKKKDKINTTLKNKYINKHQLWVVKAQSCAP